MFAGEDFLNPDEWPVGLGHKVSPPRVSPSGSGKRRFPTSSSRKAALLTPTILAFAAHKRGSDGELYVLI